MDDNVSAIYESDPLTWDYGVRKGILNQYYDEESDKPDFVDDSSSKKAWLTALPFSCCYLSEASTTVQRGTYTHNHRTLIDLLNRKNDNPITSLSKEELTDLKLKIHIYSLEKIKFTEDPSYSRYAQTLLDEDHKKLEETINAYIASYKED